jgi:hypothetical protein
MDKKKHSSYLIVELCPATPHFETSIEISKRLDKLGHNTSYFPIFQSLPFLDFFSSNSNLKTSNAVSDWLELANQHLPARTKWISVEELDREGRSDPDAATIHVLKAAVYSSITQRLQLPKHLLHFVDYKDLFDQVFDTAVLVMKYVEAAILKGNIDSVVVFNGRFANCAAAALAAEGLRREVYYHERGPALDKYFLQKTKIHDLRGAFHLINDYAADKPKTVERELVAAAWFEKKRRGATDNWHVFSSDRQPSTTVHSEYNVFFTSSMDEYDYIENNFWSIGLGDQLQAIETLIRIHKELGKCLVVRIHPNIRNKHTLEKIFWEEYEKKYMEDEIIIFEGCESEVSSYALMEAADIVFHAGSTIGIESIFWGKRTYAVTQWLGIHHESTMFVSTEESIRNVIENDPVNQDYGYRFALEYGYYQETSGIKFEYFRPTTLFSGGFRDLPS